MAILNAIVPIAAGALVGFMFYSRHKVSKADKAAREARAAEFARDDQLPAADPTDPRERKL